MQRLPKPPVAVPRFVLVVLVALVGAAFPGLSAGCAAQTNANGIPPDSSLPAFEVISVKHTPSGPGIINALLTYPGGRLVAKGSTVEYLLMEASEN